MNDMTVNYFPNITASLLKAFIKVRIAENLSSLKDTDAPKKRVKNQKTIITSQDWHAIKEATKW